MSGGDYTPQLGDWVVATEKGTTWTARAVLLEERSGMVAVQPPKPAGGAYWKPRIHPGMPRHVSCMDDAPAWWLTRISTARPATPDEIAQACMASPEGTL